MNNMQIKTPTPEELQAAHESFMSYLRNNPNNFSYWFPHIKGLNDHGISIPKSTVIPVPEEIYKSFFRENEGDDERIDSWVTSQLLPVIETSPWMKNRKIFIKNGCFSNKFDFANGCLIADPNDEETLIKNICNRQYLFFFFCIIINSVFIGSNKRQTRSHCFYGCQTQSFAL